MLRLHFAIAAIVVAGTASSVFALPLHVPGSEAEASIGSSYFGRLPDSSVQLGEFDTPELAVIIQEDDPHKHIHDTSSDEHHPYSLTEVEVEDSIQMVGMPYAHHEDEISDSSLSMPNSEYWRERDARSLIPRGRDKAENSEEASRETAHKVAKRTHEDDQLPELQTKLDACVKKLAKIQEQFEECQNILVECQRELSEYTAASKKAESGSDGHHGVFKIVELHPDWQFSCANVKQIFSGSGVESNSTNAPIFVQKPQPRYLGAA